MPPNALAVSVKSPKSLASPFDAIVIKSMVLKNDGEFVCIIPQNTPRVDEERPLAPLLALVVSRKSSAFPVDAIVMKSIVFKRDAGPVPPPAIIPLVPHVDGR